MGMNGRTHQRRGVAIRLGVLGGALGLGVATGHLAGCQKALFPQDEQRTQFDRYDRSRDAYAPAFVEDEFGRQRPNLQGRLSPK